jgi:hypothetical protein
MFIDASSPEYDSQREAFPDPGAGTSWPSTAALAGIPQGEAFKAITEL